MHSSCRPSTLKIISTSSRPYHQWSNEEYSECAIVVSARTRAVLPRYREKSWRSRCCIIHPQLLNFDFGQFRAIFQLLVLNIRCPLVYEIISMAVRFVSMDEGRIRNSTTSSSTSDDIVKPLFRLRILWNNLLKHFSLHSKDGIKVKKAGRISSHCQQLRTDDRGILAHIYLSQVDVPAWLRPSLRRRGLTAVLVFLKSDQPSIKAILISLCPHIRKCSARLMARRSCVVTERNGVGSGWSLRLACNSTHCRMCVSWMPLTSCGGGRRAKKSPLALSIREPVCITR